MAVLFRCFLITLFLTWTTGCASLPNNVERPVSNSWAAPEQTALGQLAQARRAQAAARADSGFRLLQNVDLALTSRIALIEGAQRTLDLQYYAIHADASTEVLLQRLKRAAQRGVRIRILLDDFNSVGEDAQVLRLAFEPNVELRLFNPLPGSRGNMMGRIFTSLADTSRIQKRMHNKLFIADSAWGIAGGRNLGDQYFGASTSLNFVDLDVLAAGRVVRDMAASFDRYWNDELAYPVQALLSKEDLDRLRKPILPGATSAESGTPAASPASPASAASAASSSSGTGAKGGTILPSVTPLDAALSDRAPMDLRTVELTWAPAVLLVDKPGKVGPDDDEVDAAETLIDGLLGLMQQARREILIVSPYFVPGQQMMDTFQQLRARNVRIRVLTNSLASNDAPAAHAGYARYRDRLLAMGVELYELRANGETAAGLLHQGSGGGHSEGGRSIAGSGPGGSKGGSTGNSGGGMSRASLHSKAVVIDGSISVIGSMNLDLRSQLKNSEVALLIRSRALALEATRQVEQTLATDAYRLERRAVGGYAWRAPKGAPFEDAYNEPEASFKLKALVNVIGPFAPDTML